MVLLCNVWTGIRDLPGQELISCLYRTVRFINSVVVVMPGPTISFCHKVLCFLPLLFVFLVLW